MELSLVPILILICLFLKSSQAQAGYYNAAVVEYKSPASSSVTSAERLALNTQEYINIIDDVVANLTEVLDIIVFPESVLVSRNDAAFVPPLTEILCGSPKSEYADFLKNLSCAAVKYGTNIVINIVEKENCTVETHENCNDSGLVLHNTDVVLNSNGTVSAKYRKWNLFGEYGLSKPRDVETPTFTIRNVTFGLFTCFDILFSEPPLKYIREMNIKHIAFPTLWFSEMPFLTALQAQQMWAHENDAVLLAAEGNNPSSGSSGSGIYLGSSGALQSEVVGNAGTTVIVQKVPTAGSKDTSFKAIAESIDEIDAKAKTMDGLYLKVDKSIVEHNAILLNTSSSRINEQVCHGSFPRICCQFNISLSVNNSIVSGYDQNQYVYQLVAFNSVRSYDGVANGGTEDCAVLACLNESLSTCGHRFSNYSQITWPISFESLSISANFTNDPKRIQFPNSLLTTIKPVPASFTTWEKEVKEDTVTRRYGLNRPQSRLLTFAVYGRDFSRDD